MHRHLLPLLGLAGLLGATACQDSEPPTGTSDVPSLAASGTPGIILGRYIIAFRSDVADPSGLARQLVAQHGGTLHFTYQYALKGFAASFPASAVAALSRNPHVAYIESDQVMRAIGVESPTPSWGLDRVDQRTGLDNSYSYVTSASGVFAYIIDTGIEFAHVDFGGRATSGYDFVSNDASADDCNGHGTHVAGTVGGASYGIAKGVSLVAVRVLDCNGSGTTSGVIAGIDWVTQHHAAQAVANMSLGGGFSQSLNDAVTNSITSGVTYGVAAGNGNFFGIPQDACNSSPASTPAAITVGATDKTDHEASFSNYGSCVDLLAPGVGITSAWYTTTTASNTISGTSMATPHVVGAAALYLAAHPTATPAQVASTLTSGATSGTITLNSTTRGTPNLLLYTLVDGTPPPPTNQPPVASFTYSCTDLSCAFNGSGSSDPDGSISTYAWTFGDATGGSGATPTHSYASGGTYQVTLTVTDNGGATNATSQNVTVSAPSSSGITLSARGYKVKGVQKADLSWSGATGTNVDLYRNGSRIAQPSNNGAYTDNIGLKGSGSYTYKVCNPGTSTCSPDVTVVF